MHDVGAGHAENDRRIGGNDDAGRNERVLLRNDAYDHRAVRLNCRAEILLHEFAGKMQAAGVDRFNVRRRLGGQVHAAEDDHGEHETDDARDDIGPPPFGLLDDIMRECRSSNTASRHKNEEIESDPDSEQHCHR